jgi:gamma-glutamyltranspeptidase/glutathione hydrolase
LFALHERHGKLPWAQVVEPALTLARDGFPMGALLHERVQQSRANLAKFPAMCRDFCDAKGAALPQGTRVRRTDLANTLAAVSVAGPDALYKGEVGRRLAAAMATDGGLITAADLAAYRVKQRQVVRLNWHGYEVLSMPPPSSGGAVLGQVLRVLDDQLPAEQNRRKGQNGSVFLHRLAEAFKHAFADRARVMGDPDFVKVPVDELLGDAAVARVRGAFKPDAVLASEAYGLPFVLPPDGGTSHFNVIDAAGNAVALTTTVNTGFGSKYVAGDTGILLNNEMDDFVARPGVPNAFGLVGRAANAIAPGKRPLSSMSPTLVRKDGQVVLAVGGSGGPTIITGTVQVLLNVLHFGLEPRAAVEAPRIHHQWVPDSLLMDAEYPEDVSEALARRGQQPKAWSRYTAVQVISRDAKTGVMLGACDPTKQGEPARVEDVLDAPAGVAEPETAPASPGPIFKRPKFIKPPRAGGRPPRPPFPPKKIIMR